MNFRNSCFLIASSTNEFGNSYWIFLTFNQGQSSVESHTNLSPSAIFCLYFRRNDSIGLIICANNCNHAFNVIILQAESEFKMLMGNKLKISVGVVFVNYLKKFRWFYQPNPTRFDSLWLDPTLARWCSLRLWGLRTVKRR